MIVPGIQMLKQTAEKLSLLGMTTFVSVASALADTAPPVPAGAPGAATSAAAPLAGQAPGFASMLLPFAAMFGVVYFLMIRPQQKKMKEQQDMLTQLKHGDEVITSSGILGTIAGITDKVVTLEVANNVRIKILKSQVSQVVKGQIKDAV
jgi:preprotein translocase subunit YajC